MKKLLLLLLVVVGIVGCNKDEGSENDKEILELQKEYNLKGVNNPFFNYKYNDVGSKIYFSGLKDEKLWVSSYNTLTKKLITEMIDDVKFDCNFRDTISYEGVRVIPVKCSVISNIYEDGNSSVFIVSFLQHKTLYSCSKGIVFFYKEKELIRKEELKLMNKNEIVKWYKNSIILVDEMTHFGNYVYDFDGNLLLSSLIDRDDIVPISMYNIIYVLLGNDFICIEAIDLKNNKSIWMKKISTVSLGLPENTKPDNAKLKSQAETILQYEITYKLYDGTKTTKTVNIDINTGEYIVL